MEAPKNEINAFRANPALCAVLIAWPFLIGLAVIGVPDAGRVGGRFGGMARLLRELKALDSGAVVLGLGLAMFAVLLILTLALARGQATGPMRYLSASTKLLLRYAVLVFCISAWYLASPYVFPSPLEASPPPPPRGLQLEGPNHLQWAWAEAYEDAFAVEKAWGWTAAALQEEYRVVLEESTRHHVRLTISYYLGEYRFAAQELGFRFSTPWRGRTRARRRHEAYVAAITPGLAVLEERLVGQLDAVRALKLYWDERFGETRWLQDSLRDHMRERIWEQTMPAASPDILADLSCKENIWGVLSAVSKDVVTAARHVAEHGKGAD